ncbi:RHS repeat-associated core domain-containing protein [Methylomonas methanica]|uniref:RHS repeat-associated core domain protein n=1 Tax=Methylomonas methanica (strain DSM 25384 / MC09) TaxID=857087 RepID=G0A198_METMM|nr:RHS repeat-associated core domain-containing protein [Methylomonas methanica]AEG02518.1 RHS repeat-associated core domain protein [Methylomonas methanica MC09]
MRNPSNGQKVTKLYVMVFASLLSLLLGMPVAQAFHFPWDQGHDTTDWNDPDKPGPCEGANCDPCKSTGSPVYIPTGHFIWSETDIVIGGRPPISITRSYNSQDPRDGIFGNGWSSNCEPALTKVANSDGSVSYILRLANGKRYEYKQQNDGSIVSPSGRLDKLKTEATNGSLSLVSQTGSAQKFNSSGQLTQRTDSNGVSLNYEYNAKGFITKISSGGRSLLLNYNSNDRVASISDHTGRTWKYAYDINGNLISVTDPLNGVRKFEYQAYKGAGDGFTYYQLTKITDESGVVVTSVTYSSGRVVSYTEGANTYTYTYNTSTRTVTKANSLSRTRKYVYNTDQVIIQETDPLNNTEKYEYNSEGKLTKFTDKQNNAWTSSYDGLGRKLTVSSPSGRVSTLQYTGDSPKPIRLVTPLGHVTDIEYDNKLNPVGLTDAKGNKSSLKYDENGNIIATIDANGGQTAFNYNDFGLPIDITDAKGNVMSFSYDGLARKVSATDAEGRTTIYAFDSLDRLVKTTNALGHQINYSYDAAGRLLSLTDPVGNLTQYNYDIYGRLSKETRPDGTFSTYTYNTANLLIQVNRYDGKTVTFSYDATDRLISSTVGGDTINYAYSARGDLSQASNGVSTINYTYNADRELISETQAGVMINRQYNQDGALTQFSSMGLTYTYNRDELNLMSSLIVGSNTFTFNYDANNVLTNISLPNGLSETYRFDEVYNLTQIKTGSKALDYTYDRTGIITQKLHNGTITSYDYDAILRLTKVLNQTYNYDNAGNNVNGGSIYDFVTNRLNENAEYIFSYDQAGNLIEKARKDGSLKKSYVYNARNQLIKVENFNQSNQVVKTLTFAYDPLGRRYSKTENNVFSKFIYDDWDIVAVLNSSDQIDYSFIHGNSSIDTPISINTDGSSYYYHRDQQGSIVSLTNSLGAEVENYSYGAYGSTSKNTIVLTKNPYAYTGRELDSDDLYYYRARYYDPTIQRFISEDPIGLSGGTNTYAYVGGNPVNLIDPTGQCPWCVGALIGAGIDVAMQLAMNGGNWQCIDLGQVALSAAFGAVGGGFGAKAGKQGLTSLAKGLSNSTKGSIGEGLSTIKNLAKGSSRIGTQVRIPGQTTIADSAWIGRNGSTYYVESKFGTSGLTRAQRAAQKALGDSYQVEKWTYPWIGDVGADAGAIAGGAAAGAGVGVASGADCGCK